MKEGIVLIANLSGHRAEYQALFSRVFDLTPLIGVVGLRNLLALLAARRLLFATLDDDVSGFVIVASLRACMGRRTVGVFLRPQSCLGPGARSRIKRVLFGALRHVPCVAIVSIIPFDFLPGSERLATHWIHDPQLWDELDRPTVPDPQTRAAIRALATRRPIIAFLGRASWIKGFSFLVAIVKKKPDLARQYCILVAGVVDDACRDQAKQLDQMGVTIWDRRLEDAEMAAVYAESSIIWACYDASYDQASGIFGRAVQRGRIAVIREGALLERYAVMFEHPCLPLPDDVYEAALRLSRAKTEHTPVSRVLNDCQSESVNTLKACL
jgi:glycosyltransferase involved in cell wall biosynthesis